MQHIRSGFKALLAIGGILLLAANVVYHVKAIESFGIGAVPANPRADNPRTKSIFVYEVPSGRTIEDAINVINNTQTQRTLKVYAVDSQRSSDGAFACAQEVEAKKEVGSWIQLAQAEVTLPPSGSQKVPFTLTVPGDAETGEHNGCIAIEEDKPASQKTGNGIVLNFRSALRVALTVPGQIFADLEFLEVKSDVTSDKVRVSPVVKNKGNVSVDANLHVALATFFGAKTSTADGQFAVLHKDESRFNFELSRPFWGGWYKVEASADYEPLREVAASGEHKTLGTQSHWLFVAPQPAAVAIYAALPITMAGICFAFWWRRRYWRMMNQQTINYPIKKGDDLQKIAAKAHTDWKQLAKLNKLKPPYALVPGVVLKIPYARRPTTDKKARKKT